MINSPLTHAGRSKYSIIPKGRVGNCARFSGSEKIVCSAVPLLSSETFIVDSQCTFSASSLHIGSPFSQYISSNTKGWTVQLRDNGAIWVRIGTGSLNTLYILLSTYSVGIETTIRIKISTGGSLFVYVNEISNGPYTIAADRLPQGATPPLTIGSGKDGNSDWFVGSVYNVNVNGRQFPLTEGSGTTVWGYDNTGQNYTGTITASDISAFWAGKQTTFFPELQYGYSAGGLGPELITNAADREFSSDTGYWTRAGLWTISDGVLSLTTNPMGGEATTRVVSGVVLNRSYKVAFDCVRTNGILTVKLGSATAIQSVTTSGRIELTFIATGATPGYLELKSTLSALNYFAGSLDNITINEVYPSTVIIPANPYTTGLDCLGNALTNPPLKFSAASNYSLPDANQPREATGWIYSTENTFYNADGTVKELTFSEIDAAGTGPRFYFGTKGTALYTVDQTAKDAQIEKILKTS